MAQDATEALVREIHVRASRDTVFAHFTDPVRMVEWFGHAATLDPRPGGTYRVEVTRSDTAIGAFVEVDPPSRVVFTFGWESGELVPPGSSTVEVTLTEDGDGTIVRLEHRGLPAASVERHGQGWTRHLDQLAEITSPERRP